MFRFHASGVRNDGCPPWLSRVVRESSRSGWADESWCRRNGSPHVLLAWESLADAAKSLSGFSLCMREVAGFHVLRRDELWAMICGYEFGPVTINSFLGEPMKPGETRQDRLKRQAAEKAAKRRAADAMSDVACAAPDPKRRPGHSRRPEWTMGRKKR